MQIVDANVVLRYVLNDNKELSTKAREIIEKNLIEIPIEVLCEVIYVLSKIYKTERKDIVDVLYGLFEESTCILTNKQVVLKGLEFYAQTKLDFVDCVLVAYKFIDDEHIIYTFDDKMKKFIKQKCKEK